MRWARNAFLAEIGSVAFIPLAIGLQARIDKKEYSHYVNAIHDLARLRLNACAHELMMGGVSKRNWELTIQAEVFAKNPKIASSFDILVELRAVMKALIADFKEVPSTSQPTFST